MKTFNNLYEKFLSDDNIRLAIINAKRGSTKGRKKKAINWMYDNMDVAIPMMRKFAENYKPTEHKHKEIYDGISRKKRIIVVPTPKEHILHHMIVNILKPIIVPSLYYHSVGSVEGRGAHREKKYIERAIRNDVKNTKYCLKIDVKKYFNSINHNILKEKLIRRIKDKMFLKIIFNVIDCEQLGLPLGFYTSQILAMFYLSDLDHELIEMPSVRKLFRYVDDIVIFSGNKRDLRKVLVFIKEHLKNRLDLSLKENWQIFKVAYCDKFGKMRGRALDFMGFVFHRNKTILRHSIMLRISRKTKSMWKKIKPSIFECKQFTSYLGYLKSTNTYNFYIEHIKPYVDVGKIKKRISNYDRRNCICGSMLSTV